MPLDIAPFSKDFVAEVSGLNLSEDLPLGVVEKIEDAITKYAVLVFRDQPLTEKQQVRFAERFGPLDAGLKKVGGKAATTSSSPTSRLEHGAMVDISNLGLDGQVVRRDDPKIVSNIANQLWHSDSSFQKPAARYSMLSAVKVPPVGGDTQFADMRAAYDALDDGLKSEIAQLEAEHFALHSRIMLGLTGVSPEHLAAMPPVTWPIVRRHPVSDRKLLFIGSHTTRVLGMTVAEGRMLLQDLLEHATQPAFVYTHKWRANDLVIWDNRATLHRGRRFDFNVHRELRRSTTSDDCSHVSERGGLAASHEGAVSTR